MKIVKKVGEISIAYEADTPDEVKQLMITMEQFEEEQAARNIEKSLRARGGMIKTGKGYIVGEQ